MSLLRLSFHFRKIKIIPPTQGSGEDPNRQCILTVVWKKMLFKCKGSKELEPRGWARFKDKNNKREGHSHLSHHPICWTFYMSLFTDSCEMVAMTRSRKLRLREEKPLAHSVTVSPVGS